VTQQTENSNDNFDTTYMLVHIKAQLITLKHWTGRSTTTNDVEGR